MKRLLLLFSICAYTIYLSAQSVSNPSDSIKHWTHQWQTQLLDDRENPAKWDTVHYNEDLREFPRQDQQPISLGVFPVPSYGLYPGTFDGVIAANFGLYLNSGQRISCVVNGNFKTSLNESFLGDNDEDFILYLQW
ncbi:MAG: hypothetical protein NC405_03985 [Odoribacter sp.]|nr:hypothetical protein [Odoribacter sp.]